MKRVQKTDQCGEEASGQKTPNWGYYGANFLFEIWTISDGKKAAKHMGKHRRKAQQQRLQAYSIAMENQKVQKSKKLRLNPQRMNATATVISSSFLHMS